MPNDKKDDRFRKLKEYLTKPYEEQAEDRSRYYVQGIKIWPHVENDVSNLDTHLLYTLANPLPEDHPGRDYFDPATGRVMSTLVSIPDGSAMRTAAGSSWRRGSSTRPRVRHARQHGVW